ncbi:MAG: ribbon-helix-helix protein, CopG family [Candidatus Helarchaeota archaeon]
MDDTVVISSIRISKEMSKKLELIAKRQGISKTELIRRALESYLPQFIELRPNSAEEVLNKVKLRTGFIPKIKKSIKSIYQEIYETENL